MEEVIKIEGGHRLHGSVRISGSKNATVALIPAAVLALIILAMNQLGDGLRDALDPKMRT